MSVEVNFAVRGAEEFAQALSRLDRQMQTKVQQHLAQWAEAVKADAARLVPVRTGYLQSTLYAKTTQWQTRIGAYATYATSVEFGTSRAQARPFLQPAIQQHLPDLERLLSEAVESAKTEAQL